MQIQIFHLAVAAEQSEIEQVNRFLASRKIVKVSRRRRRRYREARAKWERRFFRGEEDHVRLQQGYASALAMTWHADSIQWRRNELRRNPWVEA